MADFDDYRTDSTYEINYTKDIAPGIIRFALALQGIAMPKGEDGQPFRYLELGFGFGTSVNTHAAAFGGEYWGVDFMAEHVAFANRLAAVSGADTHFLRKSFEETDAMAQAGELPQFDVIAFHGIYSWVNAANRRHLVNIVDKCLKPGGVVYNSYNAQPGWSNFMPVRELMRLNGERLGDDRPIEDRVKETLVYTEALADAGAAFFKINPAAGMRLKGLAKMPLHYLAQEYFNRTWRPFYFAEVVETFNAIGCPSDDVAIKGLYTAFTKRLRDEMGIKFQCVTYDNAADYEGVVNIMNPVTTDGANAFDLVPWGTSVIAGTAVNATALNMVYDGEYAMNVNYTQTQLEAAIKDGKFAFHRVGKDVCVLADINSLVTETVDKNKDFKMNQVVRVVDQDANGIAVLFNSKYLGKNPNTPDRRVELWNDITKLRDEMQKLEAIQNFSPDDVEVLPGVDKDSVVVNAPIEPVVAMAKLYATIKIL